MYTRSGIAAPIFNFSKKLRTVFYSLCTFHNPARGVWVSGFSTFFSCSLFVIYLFICLSTVAFLVGGRRPLCLTVLFLPVSLAWEGRIVVLGFAGGSIASVPANLLLLKNISAMGLYWGRYQDQDFPVFSRSLSSALQYCQQGRIRPYVGSVFKLEEVRLALGAWFR